VTERSSAWHLPAGGRVSRVRSIAIAVAVRIPRRSERVSRRSLRSSAAAAIGPCIRGCDVTASSAVVVCAAWPSSTTAGAIE